MFCPQCRAEYREGFTRCGSCDVELVPELPPEEEPSMDDYMVAMTTTDETMLIIAKSLLDAAEIPYMIRGEDILNVFPGLLIGAASRDSYDMIAIIVPKEYIEEATELLAGIEPSSESDYDDADSDEEFDDESTDDTDYSNDSDDSDGGSGDGINLRSRA